MIGTQMSIAFSSGFLANGLDFTHASMERAAIDVSSWASVSNGYREFDPGALVDGGELNVDLIHDPSAIPPIAAAKETCTVTYPDAGAAAWAFDAFMTSYEVRGAFEDKIMASCTIKVAGPITVTP